MIWKILEIEKTKDENVIKDAYRKKLRFVNPEDDQEGFKELRKAYDEAMAYASLPEGVEQEEQHMPENYKKTEVDLWIDRIDSIYKDVKKRRDESCWRMLLNDEVCDDLDTELEASEKLLVYFMSHSYMPQNIWKMVEQRFHYMDDFTQLKERFPEHYLEYIKWQIEHPGFIDYELFDGKTDDKVDELINTIYEERNAFEDGDMENVKKLIQKMHLFDLTHPFTQVEEARYLLACDKKQEALDIMEELDFEYSDNPYIERIYGNVLVENGQIDRARSVYDAMLEIDEKNTSALLGKARCAYLSEQLEEAKELVEDVLEERVQDVESMDLLDQINEKLIENYQAALDEAMDREICFKLGWCYYQKREFDKGIALLDRIEEKDEYDYVNLRCRLYLANEEYEKAFPLTKKWLKMIKDTEDDGTKEAKKRKNRLSLAYFSIGVCLWEQTYHQKNDGEKVDEAEFSSYEEAFESANTYIGRAIEKEHNTLVRLSYMEQMAKFYIAQKKYEACVQICTEILQQDRGFYPAYVHRQRAHYELKNAKEVVEDYFSCKEIYAGYSVPYVLAAEVFMAFEQYDDVESVIEAGKEANLESDGLKLYEIKCLHYKNFSKENVQTALEELKLLIDAIKSRESEAECDIEDQAELYREMAILYWDLDMTKEALNTLNDYLKQEPKSGSALTLKIDILNREKKYEEALDACQTLISLDADNLNYQMKLGNCYERMEEDEKAIACYQSVLEKDENYVPAIRRMMYIYSYLSTQKRDMELCKKGIEFATRWISLAKNADPFVERGNLYIDLYELEKAVEDCKMAISLDADAYYAYNNLGCALLKLRRIEEAKKPLLQVIKKDPERDYLPYLNLADCYILMGEYEKAIEAYQKVMDLRSKKNEKRDATQEEIVKIYCMQKKYKQAILYYEDKIKKMKSSIELLAYDEKGKIKLNVTKDESLVREWIRYCCKVADIYRQAKLHKMARNYYEKAWKQFMKCKKMYVSPDLEEMVEYYRDLGEYEKARKFLMKMLERAKKGNVVRNSYRFKMATILFELGDYKNATLYADAYIENRIQQYGSEEKMLEDRRYRPMNLYNIAMMHVCAKRLELAKKYIEQIRDCHLCVTCVSCDCFEYYFGMGIIAQIEGKKEEAKRFYQQALHIKPDYPCCKNHLKML